MDIFSPKLEKLKKIEKMLSCDCFEALLSLSGQELNSRRHLEARKEKLLKLIGKNEELYNIITKASDWLMSQAKASRRSEPPAHSCEEVGLARKKIKALYSRKESASAPAEVAPAPAPASGKITRHYHREKGTVVEFWYKEEEVPFPVKKLLEELLEEDPASIKAYLGGLSARARNTLLKRKPELIKLYKK